jgi:hypothetical protein
MNANTVGCPPGRRATRSKAGHNGTGPANEIFPGKIDRHAAEQSVHVDIWAQAKPGRPKVLAIVGTRFAWINDKP